MNKIVTFCSFLIATTLEHKSTDRIDIMALLLFSEIDFKKYTSLLEEHNLKHYFDRLFNIINNFDGIKYLDLNPREFKLKKRELLGKMGKKNKR